MRPVNICTWCWRMSTLPLVVCLLAFFFFVEIKRKMLVKLKFYLSLMILMKKNLPSNSGLAKRKFINFNFFHGFVFFLLSLHMCVCVLLLRANVIFAGFFSSSYSSSVGSNPHQCLFAWLVCLVMAMMTLYVDCYVAGSVGCLPGYQVSAVLNIFFNNYQISCGVITWVENICLFICLIIGENNKKDVTMFELQKQNKYLAKW